MVHLLSSSTNGTILSQLRCDLQCQAGKISSEAIPPWKVLEAVRALHHRLQPDIRTRTLGHKVSNNELWFA